MDRGGPERQALDQGHASVPSAGTGLRPATGGDGSDAGSGDMLLQALLGCAGVTPQRSVATAVGVDVGPARLSAEGELEPAAPSASRRKRLAIPIRRTAIT